MEPVYCSTCDQWKPAQDFYRDRSRKTGYQATCKPCKTVYRLSHSDAHNASSRRSYARRIDAERARHRARYREDPSTTKHRAEKHRHKNRASYEERMRALAQQGTQTLLCVYCHTLKPATDFSIDRTRESGRQARCKRCYQQWQHEHKEALQRYFIEYYEQHKPFLRQQIATYQQAHPEKTKQWNKNWQRNNAEKVADGTRRYNARKKHAPVLEHIDQALIYKRDQGICQLCHKHVSKKFRFPHPFSPTYDHVIPISLGGEHSSRNVVLTHWQCNNRKGNKSVPQQQRLF